jgi:prephenate dehydratase
LAQCAKFFAAHPQLARVAAHDTAGSVRALMERGDASFGAIAGRRAGALYGASLLAENIEDHAENYTRFLLLEPKPRVPPGARKVSLALRLAHRPGALSRALEPLAASGIDLLKIESRPLHGSPWQYLFYLDLLAPHEDPSSHQALKALEARVDSLRLLGWYPPAALSR